MFSSFSHVSWKNYHKLIVIGSPYEKITRLLSLDVLGSFHVSMGLHPSILWTAHFLASPSKLPNTILFFFFSFNLVV